MTDFLFVAQHQFHSPQSKAITTLISKTQVKNSLNVQTSSYNTSITNHPPQLTSIPPLCLDLLVSVSRFRFHYQFLYRLATKVFEILGAAMFLSSCAIVINFFLSTFSLFTFVWIKPQISNQFWELKVKQCGIVRQRSLQCFFHVTPDILAPWKLPPFLGFNPPRQPRT